MSDTGEESELGKDAKPPRLGEGSPDSKADSSSRPDPRYAIDPKVDKMEGKARRRWLERQL